MAIDPISILLLLLLVGLIVGLVMASRRRSAAMQGIQLSEKYNTLAVLSFVLAFFVSVAAIVLGHLAISQINRTNERGWGLAVAGTTIGYVGLVAGSIGIVIWVSALVAYL